jgi:hypothetical protein
VDGHDATSNVPPAGFSVATATSSELALYGIPPDPPATSGTQRATWQELFGNPQLHFLTPPSQLHSVPTWSPSRDNNSQNWSGFVAYNGGYSNVSGDYTEPSLGASRCATNSVSFWVGLGGFGTGVPLAQDGTAENVGGLGQNQAWFEFFPQVGMIDLNLYATPGQGFYAATTYDYSNIYTFFLMNVYTGAVEDFNAAANQSFNGSTAEWIAERPCSANCTSGNPTFTNLSNFQTMYWNLTGYNSGAGNAYQTSNYQTYMEDSSYNTLASPSSLASNGSFSITQNSCS